ncbi:hypothetical protein CPB84DRAFT_1743229 [Gymnopilus junonius]|uniref:Uncharacterized protein n=1 Tax=Gymnopilus junonius TaxID=109634 RepID=A0A9P5TST7_GYMJU|nr:hypothetical protein CPB84DRAFT_1743229 [Gymnopilus junonius]
MSLQQANLMTIEAPKLLVMDTGHPRVAQRSPAPVPIKTCTLGHGYGYLPIWAWVLRGFIPVAGALDGLHGRKTPDSHLQVREMEEWWQWYAASMVISTEKAGKNNQNELTISLQTLLLLTWPGLPLHGSPLHVQPPSSTKMHAHSAQRRAGACNYDPRGEREGRRGGKRKGSGGGDKLEFGHFRLVGMAEPIPIGMGMGLASGDLTPTRTRTHVTYTHDL